MAARSEMPLLTWRGRRCSLGVLLFFGLAALKPQTSFVSPRASRPWSRTHARVAVRAEGAGSKDPLNNIDPGVTSAAMSQAKRLEDIFMSGRDLWAKMKKEGKEKKFYFIGTNGCMHNEVAESVMDALAYIPAHDGSLAIFRKPNVQYEMMEFHLWDTDDMVSDRSRIAALDLFMENEEEYRDLEHAVLKEFDELDFEDGNAQGCIVGESALNRQENVDIIKKGIVIWSDSSVESTWRKTQMPLGTGKGGISLKGDNLARPPIWALAQGWEADPDDGEARVEYQRIVSQFAEEYEKVADIRVRVDVPGMRENTYWVAERIMRALYQFLGLATQADDNVDAEIFQHDLEKFLEGARLTKYLEAATKWCNEQGATSIDELAENIAELEEALDLKPLERKRLQKAALVLNVAA